jgi:hypothetical protein
MFNFLIWSLTSLLVGFFLPVACEKLRLFMLSWHNSEGIYRNALQQFAQRRSLFHFTIGAPLLLVIFYITGESFFYIVGAVSGIVYVRIKIYPGEPKEDTQQRNDAYQPFSYDSKDKVIKSSPSEQEKTIEQSFGDVPKKTFPLLRYGLIALTLLFLLFAAVNINACFPAGRELAGGEINLIQAGSNEDIYLARRVSDAYKIIEVLNYGSDPHIPFAQTELSLDHRYDLYSNGRFTVTLSTEEFYPPIVRGDFSIDRILIDLADSLLQDLDKPADAYFEAFRIVVESIGDFSLRGDELVGTEVIMVFFEDGEILVYLPEAGELYRAKSILESVPER